MEIPAVDAGNVSKMAPRSPRLRWALLLLPAALLAWSYRSLDWTGVFAAVGRTGPLVFLALLPFALAMALDTLAWKRLLANLGHFVRLRDLLALRVSTEALCVGLPGGPLLADGLSPYLLQRNSGVPIAAGFASITARKCLLLLAQALYLGLGVALGYRFLRRVSPGVIHAQGLQILLAVVSGLLFLLAAAFLAAIFSGSIAARAGRGLDRLPLGPLLGWWRRLGAPAGQIDGELVRSLGSRPQHLLGPLAFYLLVWMTEVAETVVILRLLGIDIGIVQACAIEPAVRCLRYAAFFIPAGWGVQELGYLLFFRGAGIGDPLTLSAAFSLLKRSREIFCVLPGLLGLALLGGLAAFRPVARAEAHP